MQRRADNLRTFRNALRGSNMNLVSTIGMVVGYVLVAIPEPTTTVIGLAMLMYGAYKSGWLGKGSV